ncbi:tautomerase family protein [Bacillus massiliigorillae]|uniref:tautomerase family protein n=1 Tax=Bacillus massiliigorillae TaxID=1243664 RepID=UPI0003A95CDB|nr:2-hydroxymuconate tautomerase family protein [Bacillus massiliigorillae]
MPFIQVTIMEGRTLDQKEQLIYELSHATAKALQSSIENIRVSINEIPSNHWGIAGESVYKRNNTLMG